MLTLIAAQPLPAAPQIERLPDGIIVPAGDGFLRLEVRSESIVRVAYAKDRAFFSHKSLTVLPAGAASVPWKSSVENGQGVLDTGKLQVRVDLATGVVTFLDSSGRPILAEKPGGRSLAAAEVQGEKVFHARQQWEPNAGESLYGLGQNQLDLVDIKGYDLDLWQHNTSVAVPFLVSSRGYGILWDNPSYTRFGDLRPFEPIPAARLRNSLGESGGLTGTYFADDHFDNAVGRRTDRSIDILLKREDPGTAIHPLLPAKGAVSVRWEGTLEPETSGEHQFQTYSDGGLRLWVDGKLVADHWRQGWLPWYELARVRLEAGRRHAIRLEWTCDDPPPVVQLRWKTPPASASTSLWSEVADGIDYYFVYGPDLDSVVAGYRRLTGPAPLMPRWAFGLWQSRQRYRTAQESIDIVKGFRARAIPFDVLVQDWFYWRKEEWGSHRFDPARFPDPAGWVRALHDAHARVMISVWAKFYPGTGNFEELRKRGFLYELNLREGVRDWIGFPYTFYDAFNPEARKLFWAQMERDLFRLGVDGWWMDASEPDLTGSPTLEGQRTHMNPTALGTGSRVLNAFPLVNSEAVYAGQRAAAPDERVCILTRSGFPGMQRYAAAVWSGDTSSTWTALRKQIPAGLSFCISGLPYWTMDTGGFAVPRRFAPISGYNDQGEPIFVPQAPADAEDWRELNTRWFEFGTFTPILRVHGEYPYREMWQFGGEQHPAFAAQLKFDRLRYRLLPYLYSLAAQATHEGGTIMRPLVMDFPGDLRARDLKDQYMFGPALLVNPVTTPKARARTVYLPQAAGWYDFWTGRRQEPTASGGLMIEAPAPYDAIPVYVRAGSILPVGPEIQHTAEKPADPITLYVYAGADGAFTLYEDDGMTYGYEKGAFARIPIRWNDAAQTLAIGKREGAFPGMLAERTFVVVRVAGDQPRGFSFEPQAGRTVAYRGEAVELALKP